MSSSKVTKTSGTAKQHRKGLRTIIVNFQSIRNKTAELEVLIDTTAPVVIIGTETWLNKDTLSSELLPDTYKVYRRDRGTNSHGRMLIAVQTSLTSFEIFSSKSIELLVVKVYLPGGKQMIVSSFYRLPSSGESYLNSFCEDITALKQQYNKAIFHIGGDFNTPDIDWSTNTHYTMDGSIYPKHISQALVQVSEDLGLEQMISCKTRGDNLQDLLSSSNPSLIEKIKSLSPIGKADYDVILVYPIMEPVRSKHQQREISGKGPIWMPSGRK